MLTNGEAQGALRNLQPSLGIQGLSKDVKGVGVLWSEWQIGVHSSKELSLTVMILASLDIFEELKDQEGWSPER